MGRQDEVFSSGNLTAPEASNSSTSANIAARNSRMSSVLSPSSLAAKRASSRSIAVGFGRERLLLAGNRFIAPGGRDNAF